MSSRVRAMATDPTYDVLGEPYTVEVLDLGEDAEGPVRATLVHRPAPEPTDRAVLHVHGFADYFFHTEYAEWWNARGHDFYALDLRKYGRSILAHQTPNYVEDLRSTSPTSTPPGPASPTGTPGWSPPPTPPAASRCRCGCTTAARPVWAGSSSTPPGSTCRARPGCAPRRRGWPWTGWGRASPAGSSPAR